VGESLLNSQQMAGYITPEPMIGFERNQHQSKALAKLNLKLIPHPEKVDDLATYYEHAKIRTHKHMLIGLLQHTFITQYETAHSPFDISNYFLFLHHRQTMRHNAFGEDF